MAQLLRKESDGPSGLAVCEDGFGVNVRSSGAAARSGRDLTRRLGPSLIPMLIMLVVGRFRASVPSLGWDENATLIVSQRTPGQIFELIRHTDASIAPYYFLMHFWGKLFGTSELALRAPSIIAMAIGVGLVGELGRRMFSPVVGLTAAILLAAVPLTSRYAQDARVYGITFLLVVLSTLLLYKVVEQPTWRRCGWYGLIVLLIGLAHMIGLSVLAGHAPVIANRWWRYNGLVKGAGRRGGAPGDTARLLLTRWLTVTAAALVLASPLIVLGLTQRDDQLDWIGRVGLTTLRNAPADLIGATSIAWLLIGLAIAATWTEGRQVTELMVAVLVPPVALLTVSFLSSPIWVPRYVLFTLAPLALLAGVAVHRSAVRTAVVVGIAVVMAWPAQMEVRGPATHHGPSFREIAGIIERHQRPGDGIVYGGASNWSLRAGVDYYLAGKQAPRDLLLVRSAAEVGRLGAQECKHTAACVGNTARVWLVRLFQHEDPLSGAGPIASVLHDSYRTVQVWRITKGTVALYERR